MLKLAADFTAGDSKRVEQCPQDVGAEDVVARGKELLRQDIDQSLVSSSGEVSWGRLAALAALVVGIIAFASVFGW